MALFILELTRPSMAGKTRRGRYITHPDNG